MYDELVKALRCGTRKQEEKEDCRWCYYFHSGECCWTIIMTDAADAIERLMAERKQMRDTLIRRICKARLRTGAVQGVQEKIHTELSFDVWRNNKHEGK